MNKPTETPPSPNDRDAMTGDGARSATRSVAEQVDDELLGARLRVVIVGAGIAGATLGALLRQRGEPAAIVERSGPAAAAGYMLGMLPLGGRVLNGLGLRDAYIAASVPVEQYSLHGRNGQLIRTYSTEKITDCYGLYRGIERGALLHLLRSEAGTIFYDATIAAVGARDADTLVTFSDGSQTAVDLVVAADGIHSATRDLVVAADEVEHYDSRWAGFVAWCETAPGTQGNYRELWGAGSFVGIYPVKGRSGVFMGGPSATIERVEPFDYAQRLAHRDLPRPFADALATIDPATEPTRWPMADIRSTVWHRDRVVLLGDAAAAFLPTAGVGASAAMDAASALADELSRAERSHIDFALGLFERRQRPRTEAAQHNSRRLATFMFECSPTKTFVRDQIARFYSVDMMVNDIRKVMEGR